MVMTEIAEQVAAVPTEAEVQALYEAKCQARREWWAAGDRWGEALRAWRKAADALRAAAEG